MRLCTLDLLSEFSSTNETSLMERLIKIGGPTRLLEQYRMHPDTTYTVSEDFYLDQQLKLLSVNDRLEINQQINSPIGQGPEADMGTRSKDHRSCASILSPYEGIHQNLVWNTLPSNGSFE